MAPLARMDGFSDLAFFALVAKCGSLAALERRLGVRLMQRTTRRLSLTPEGETYLVDGARVLEDLEQLERTVGGTSPRRCRASCGCTRRSRSSCAHNHRVLCAAPPYLQSAGEPTTPHDLARHACLFIREGDETFGTWHLRNGTRHETDAVFATRSHLAAKTRALIDFLVETFAPHRQADSDRISW